MLNPMISDINFVIDSLLVLFLCFDIVFFMIKKLNKDGDEMLSAKMYSIERARLL